MPEFLISDPNDTVLEITVFDSDLFSPNGKNIMYLPVFCTCTTCILSSECFNNDNTCTSLFSLSLIDFLGCAKLSLKQLRDEGGNNGPWTKSLLLEDVPKGELALRVTYQPMRRNISGTH